jgi:hypothetical protein
MDQSPFSEANSRTVKNSPSLRTTKDEYDVQKGMPLDLILILSTLIYISAHILRSKCRIPSGLRVRK